MSICLWTQPLNEKILIVNRGAYPINFVGVGTTGLMSIFTFIGSTELKSSR